MYSESKVNDIKRCGIGSLGWDFRVVFREDEEGN